jgi:hypothetical protein
MQSVLSFRRDTRVGPCPCERSPSRRPCQQHGQKQARRRYPHDHEPRRAHRHSDHARRRLAWHLASPLERTLARLGGRLGRGAGAGAWASRYQGRGLMRTRALVDDRPAGLSRCSTAPGSSNSGSALSVDARAWRSSPARSRSSRACIRRVRHRSAGRPQGTRSSSPASHRISTARSLLGRCFGLSARSRTISSSASSRATALTPARGASRWPR